MTDTSNVIPISRPKDPTAAERQRRFRARKREQERRNRGKQRHLPCHCVYVIRSEPGPVKIGKAINASKRLKDLQTSSPFPLSLEYVAGCGTESASGKIEKRAQKSLHEKQMSGEWFNVPVLEAIVAIETAASELGLGLKRWGPRFTVNVKVDAALQDDLIAAGFLRVDDKTERGIVEAIKRAVQGYTI